MINFSILKISNNNHSNDSRKNNLKGNRVSAMKKIEIMKSVLEETMVRGNKT